MARVLSLSSQTVYGPVGNSAAVPALQALGHEVLQVPTIVLSNHPGHGPPQGQATPAALMEGMLQAVASLGALAGCQGVMTGYFASAAQVEVAAGTIARMAAENPQLTVCVDPVLGDDGALYVPGDVAHALRDTLLPLATITTPNLFELGWLTASAPVADVATAARRLGVAECVVTSVPEGSNSLASVLVTAGQSHSVATPRKASVPHGTGDFLAGSYLGQRLANAAPQAALDAAMARLQQAIARSSGAVLSVV